MEDTKPTTEKNAAASLAILMAMRIRRYGAERIAQYGRSRATLVDPRCHWTLPSGDYVPRIAPADATVIDLGVKIELRRCEFTV